MDVSPVISEITTAAGTGPNAAEGMPVDSRQRKLRALCAQVSADWDEYSTDGETPLYFESIAAAELKALIEAEFDASLPLVELIEEPTLNGLLDLIDAAVESGTSPEGLPVLVGDVGGRFEAFGLTDVQHAYWLGRSGLFDLWAGVDSFVCAV
ncbi:phosphopantetheine-binding protein [Streptomyces sp. SPB162]|uniref:acyl carrier protein n=1 Tax=Streptomyces sp. SPB162 TaxID=2940560 RepID=UPI002406A6DB|nr:phosphopantetheine-binding protein [Streptomyces sp. SPB162]MDF9817164.1 acyl carrier protein [Streptomyces sp. SPB162]